MEDTFPTEWSSGGQRGTGSGRATLAPGIRWADLRPYQQANFVDEADWRAVRDALVNGEEWPEEVVDLPAVTRYLGLEDRHVYGFMAERSFPVGFRAGGRWCYNMRAVRRWVRQMGGLLAVLQLAGRYDTPEPGDASELAGRSGARQPEPPASGLDA